MKHKTREQWLEAAVQIMTPLFRGAEYKVPKIRVSCGWPSSRATGSASYAIGECWSNKASEDGKHQIFISPRIKNPVDNQGVLPTLVHEVCHAVVGLKEKHNGVFKKCANEVGLEGKMTATHAGETLVGQCKQWVKKLGPYPHALLKPGYRPTKKQTTRLIKCECKECGYVARVSRKWLDEVGAPLCPCEAGEMKFKIEL